MCKEGGDAKEHSVSKAMDAMLSSAAAKRSTNSSTELKMALLDEFVSNPDKNFNMMTIFLRTVSGTLFTSSIDPAGLEASIFGAFETPFEFVRSTGAMSKRRGYFLM